MNASPEPIESFSDRHIGPSEKEISSMLESLGVSSMDALVDEVVPTDLISHRELALPDAKGEVEALQVLRETMSQNDLRTSFIGRGYYDSVTPPVVQRCVLENPGWYTAYTPYQAEISQGRLEALLNFQTLICELTGLPVANASLLDEATAAAEALAMAATGRPRAKRFHVDRATLPQTIDVLQTRAEPLGIEIEVTSFEDFDPGAAKEDSIGILLQYPGETGEIRDFQVLCEEAKSVGLTVIVAADPLALTLLSPPGEWGADIVVGSAQRFGVPLGFGGPHAAYMACSDKWKRRLPGRLVGVSRDADGRPALRLSLQTREQHIRREKATSNICTAQVLLAVMAGFYAVCHGREGLCRIASRVHEAAARFAAAIEEKGMEIVHGAFFDTVLVRVDDSQREAVLSRCRELGVNLRMELPSVLGVSFDQKVIENGKWIEAFSVFNLPVPPMIEGAEHRLPGSLARTDSFLEQPVFSRFRTETELLRYIRRLEGKDIALNQSMIPLGSCTMKLNAASEMFPLSWDTVGGMHPFVPPDQARGYLAMIEELETWLAEITDFDAVSLQPNAGSQGEYAGLLAIRRYHESRGEPDRKACLIPMSAHGTNPASAVMAGFDVVAVSCDSEGNIDVADLRQKAEDLGEALGALMITYPSTHGVFEESVVEICETIHRCGGQVYMDGANLNAQVGLCSPGGIGADVCHLNLHKTFCIPHGGGGPGVGPIGVAAHLTPFLPGHGEWAENSSHAVSAAPYGSASILTISWMYIAMMGPGLRKATEVAILNANYIASRLESYFPVLYRGHRGRVAHECIIDVRGCKETAGVDVEDIAKRLIDFGFHAPTMSWPVAGTLMIEPTESESLEELDRFCDAMIAIHGEIEAIIAGTSDAESNALKLSPHPAETLLRETWDRSYTRESAAYPLDWVRDRKFWAPVGRIDNVFGDRNLVCTCEGMENYTDES